MVVVIGFMPSNVEEYRPIFVGGLQRSGTTLIGRLLAQHPGVAGLRGTGAIMDEGQFLQDVYPDDSQMGERFGRVGGVIRWGYHPKAHLTELDATDPSFANRLLQAWAPYFDKPDAQTFVEKSPSNVTKMRFLQAIFPNATVIVVTRNPIIQSLAVRKWAPRHIQVGLQFEKAVEHWLTVMETYRADAGHVLNATVMPFETFVDSPNDAIRTLQEHAGLSPSSVDTSQVRSSSEVYVDYWHRMREGLRPVRAPLNPAQSAKSAAPRLLERVIVPLVGKRTVRRIERDYGERIARFGYDTVELDKVGPWR